MQKSYLQYIKDIADFPKEGIVFKDIAPLLANVEARQALLTDLAAPFLESKVDVVIGIESRGFLFGMMLANVLNARFVMARKAGKLPGPIISQDYSLEYGVNSLELQIEALKKGDKVLIHDDVLATGGTVHAVELLVKQCQAEIIAASFIIEIEFLKGRNKLMTTHVSSALIC